MAGASQQQWDLGLDVVRYLKGAQNLELTYRRHENQEMDIVAYADSDFANDTMTGKSVYGYVIFVGGNAVQWKSKKAQTTATSTTIAEIDAVYHCATDCKWMGEFLVSLGIRKTANFKVYCDNQSAVKVLQGEKYLDQTKHETVKIEYLRDLIRSGVMSVEWIGTDNMIADGLTKGLGRNKFDKFVRNVGLRADGVSGFRGSEEVEKVNPESGWTLVEGRKKRKNALRKF